MTTTNKLPPQRPDANVTDARSQREGSPSLLAECLAEDYRDATETAEALLSDGAFTGYIPKKKLETLADLLTGNLGQELARHLPPKEVTDPKEAIDPKKAIDPKVAIDPEEGIGRKKAKYPKEKRPASKLKKQRSTHHRHSYGRDLEHPATNRSEDNYAADDFGFFDWDTELEDFF